MEIKRTKKETKQMTFNVVMKEITPRRDQDFEPFISYEASIDGQRVSCRFTRAVDTKPLENLYKEGIRRFKMTCDCDGISPQFTYPRCYVSKIHEVEITE